MINYPFKTPALLIEQPMGSFYSVVLPAELLLHVAYSDALSASYDESSGTYTLDGTQRLPQPKRLDPIADYINRADSSFPNAIILAANHRISDGLTEDDPEEDLEVRHGKDRRWSVTSELDGDGNRLHYLSIPTPDKLAAIIDGQHRLFAFARALPDRRSMQLLCSIFLDLPKPYQAQLFATINSTQKPVDKSLTFELFGYNISEEPSERWSPDKLAVFLSRRLATEEGSPLRGRIVIAPKRDERLDQLADGRSWKVSTAVVVEGIMRLFTTDPKRDTNMLMQGDGRGRKSLSGLRSDRSPLRSLYIDGNDLVIYELVKNYLMACDRIFWKSPSPDSFITRTVGVQALFDILRTNVAEVLIDRDITVERFSNMLEPSANIDFSSLEFKNASGSGRSMIRKTIQAAIRPTTEKTPA